MSFNIIHPSLPNCIRIFKTLAEYVTTMERQGTVLLFLSEMRHILHDFCFSKYEEELCKNKIVPGASVAWCRRPALSVTDLVYPPSEIH